MTRLPEIEAARKRTAGEIVRTPCVPSSSLSRELDAEIWLKCEGLQRTGSFKPRGALNRILTLSPDQRDRGVVAASAGNHAQGVAFAAARIGIPALIVMPEITPLVKISRTRRWGAEIELHGETLDDALERARELEKAGNFAFVHPFDDEEIIAGQGTVGLEIVEEVSELDVVVAPVGGGGLISGISAAVQALRPEARIYGVQTEAAPAMVESVRSGSLTPVSGRRSIADGIAVKRPGELTFRAILDRVDDVVPVEEEEIEDAIFRLLEAEKLVAEGAGAAAYAAVRAGRIPNLSGRRVVVVLSGANIDLNILGRLIERSLVRQFRLTRLRVTIQDRPGALAEVLGIVAESGANVLRIHHERHFSEATVWETEVELTLEIRDQAHIEGLLQDLRDAGYDRVEKPDLELLDSPILPR